MNFSTELIPIDNKCNELVQIIVESEIFNTYIMFKNNLNNDENASSIIQKFTKIKDQYEEVQRFGKYHPDYNNTRKLMSEIKIELDTNLSISNFKRAEKELQKLLDEIGLILAESVSESIIVASDSGSLQKNCSCSSGKKGCSCK
jgi:cell fate (sporulation/competence/biofilm development) regulator YlbF (YheA/YmcA/DUF963 family)